MELIGIGYSYKVLRKESGTGASSIFAFGIGYSYKVLGRKVELELIPFSNF